MIADFYFEEEYGRLRQMAASFVYRNAGNLTVSATGLVHEVYLRLIRESRQFADRQHFLYTAAGAMRQIIVDQARARLRVKRGGEFQRITLSAAEIASGDAEFDVLPLQDALTRLEQFDARQSRIVELRFFIGLSVEEVADVMEISERTVKREWAMARAWLQRELRVMVEDS